MTDFCVTYELLDGPTGTTSQTAHLQHRNQPRSDATDIWRAEPDLTTDLNTTAIRSKSSLLAKVRRQLRRSTVPDGVHAGSSTAAASISTTVATSARVSQEPSPITSSPRIAHSIHRSVSALSCGSTEESTPKSFQTTSTPVLPPASESAWHEAVDDLEAVFHGAASAVQSVTSGRSSRSTSSSRRRSQLRTPAFIRPTTSPSSQVSVSHTTNSGASHWPDAEAWMAQSAPPVPSRQPTPTQSTAAQPRHRLQRGRAPISSLGARLTGLLQPSGGQAVGCSSHPAGPDEDDIDSSSGSSSDSDGIMPERHQSDSGPTIGARSTAATWSNPQSWGKQNGLGSALTSMAVDGADSSDEGERYGTSAPDFGSPLKRLASGRIQRRISRGPGLQRGGDSHAHALLAAIARHKRRIAGDLAMVAYSAARGGSIHGQYTRTDLSSRARLVLRLRPASQAHAPTGGQSYFMFLADVVDIIIPRPDSTTANSLGHAIAPLASSHSAVWDPNGMNRGTTTAATDCVGGGCGEVAVAAGDIVEVVLRVDTLAKLSIAPDGCPRQGTDTQTERRGAKLVVYSPCILQPLASSSSQPSVRITATDVCTHDFSDR